MKRLPYAVTLLLALSACSPEPPRPPGNRPRLTPDSLDFPQVTPAPPAEDRELFHNPFAPQELPPYAPRQERPLKPGEDPDAVEV
ncbi:MAG: hypothetical protein KF690_08585 [Bacteroidetes bacterium]|nr:hypothetical protein [Bacteroidota bacterium]